MPQIPTKPTAYYPNLTENALFNSKPLSNRSEHLGKRVRCIRGGKLKGTVGKITDVVTAEDRRHTNSKDIGRRGVYYTVELPNVILVGLTWEDFLTLGSN